MSDKYVKDWARRAVDEIRSRECIHGVKPRRLRGFMTPEEHAAMGVELRAMRNRLLRLSCSGTKMTRKSQNWLIKAMTYIDMARSELDSMAHRDHGSGNEWYYFLDKND